MLAAIYGLFVVTLSFANVIEAPIQLIDYQQNPSSIDWKKIDTDHFEIIFPKEIESDAQRVAQLLEKAYPLVARSLEVAPAKISLILQNQSTVSNGFVTLAPRRSEWYVTPSIDPVLTNTDWLKTLAVHEFRHVVQFQKSRQGFNKVFEIILGEIGQALGIGLSFPPWFLEGDAVGIETALTTGGRGRLPLFERDLKALLLSEKDFDYDKAHLGSFKDYIPNHYVYGYFYTSYMRNRYGDLFLSQLANRSTRRSYNPLTFYNAYEDLTSEGFEDFYRSTIKDLIKNWRAKEQELKLTPYEVKNIISKNDWNNYLYPQAFGEKHFLALKSGLSHINQFVISDGKEEKTIHYPGTLQNEYPYKLRKNRFAFIEWEVDPRWGYRDFSRIRVFDLVENKIIADLRQTKARLAVLDFTGKHLLYVTWDEKQEQEIIVKNLQGKSLYQLKYPKQKVITSLDWLSSNEIALVVKGLDDLKSIVKLSLESQEETVLLEESLINLGFLTTYEGRLLVESPKSGIDNIYEVKNGLALQITSSRFGAYAPSVYKNKLIYNDYSAFGMNVVTKNLIWDEEQKSKDSFVPVFEKFAAKEESEEFQKDSFNNSEFAVTPYSQFKNSVNLHSWLLLAPPLSSTITVLGYSRDVLNKFSLTAGYSYDLNEKESQGFVGAAWSHYYPVFDLQTAYGGRNHDILVNGATSVKDHWEEGTFQGGIQIPWKKITGRFTQSFNFRGFGKVIKVTSKRSSDLSEIRDGALFSPGAEAQYSFVSRLAARDLNPSLGFSIVTHFEEGRDTTGKDMNGSLLFGDGRVYLPSFFQHHSFFHQLGYEKQIDKNYQYGSALIKPRGTKNVFLEESRKYSGNYLFPLLYPDWHLSRYAYFKRISVNLFYDEQTGYFRSFAYHAASTGWEVLLDTHFFRIFIPITLGVRGSYVLHGAEVKNNYEIFITTLGGNF